ncbi:hypothetical protein HY642_00310 [Candidatus Woesearchaeota archaeon]|nr:hypothetical protein [Candidatus Woesearchaeota archaeon]
MAFTVSARSYDELKSKATRGEPFLPDECRRNSEVFFHLLQYTPRVLPSFSKLSEKDVRMIADIVAYMIRPDIVKTGSVEIGPCPLPAQPVRGVCGEDGLEFHVKNSPETLHPGFELGQATPRDEGILNRAAECFRCYNAVFDVMPHLYGVLTPGSRSLKGAFILADVTGYLLDPNDLTDYSYTATQRSRFNRTLDDEMRTV